ncbi:MAG: alpha/beta hydrolase family protein [Gemmatimonadaceae bacterium]
MTVVHRTLLLAAAISALVPCGSAPAFAQSPRMGYRRVAQADSGTTTIFYPTLAEEAAVTKGPFRFSWAEDAAPIKGNGRLVVISHGSGGSPWVHTDLARTLVQAGFVVAIPEHAGDNYLDPSEPGPTSWKLRPLEVSRAIDRLEAHPAFSPLIRFDSVGVFGGSAGGHTALTLAGGEWSPRRLRDHCLSHIQRDFSSCVGLTTQLRGNLLDGPKIWVAKLIIRARFGDSTVQRYRDERVRAAIAMVPFAADFALETLKDPAIPLGLIIAERDVNQVPEFHAKAVQVVCQPRCEILAQLTEGGHGAMLSPLPPLEPGSIAERLLSDPPAFNRLKAVPELHDAIAQFFLRRLAVR